MRSIGMTTNITNSRYSTQQRSSKGFGEEVFGSHDDLISFLGYMQKSGVDYLPIKWEPARADVGRGGSARISQARIKNGTSFAFKRLFFDGTNTQECFERSAKEALILRHIQLINHENFIRLEAFCCEIFAEPERLSPVLIFNSFPLGNLQDFMLSERNVTINERIRFCGDVAKALATLHNLHVIHGDIKPLNALVFEQDGMRMVKLADFGDASICDDDDSLVFLPKSIPWEPPEHHYRGIPFRQAIQLEIYSFGLLCLWVIIGDYLHLSLTNPVNLQDGSQISDGSFCTVAMLAMLRRTQRIQEVARKSVLECKTMTLRQQSNLDCLFNHTLAEDCSLRSTNFQAMLELLDLDREAAFQLVPIHTLESGTWKKSEPRAMLPPILKHWAPSARQYSIKKHWEGFHPKFDLAGYMTILLHADRRIRVSIVQELLQQYRASTCFRCKQHVALQVALSYHTGYGIPRNLEYAHEWLEKSGRSKEELDFQIEYARILVIPPYVNVRLRELQSQFIYEVDHAHEYRSIPENSILDIKTVLGDEVRGIGISFGETHDMTIILKRTLAHILNKYGLYNEAAGIQEHLIEQLKRSRDIDTAMKVLADLCHTYSLQDRLQLAEQYQEEVADYYTQHLGEDHMGTLGSLTNLAHTQTELGKWKQSEATLLQVIAALSRIVGDEHKQILRAKSILAAVYLRLGYIAPADSLQSHILEARVKTLGQEHELTWQSMANLAIIRSFQGRHIEAEKMELEVLDLRTNFLGSMHPDTLTSMYNLARTYGKNKSVDQEEALLSKVLGARIAVLGSKHGDTITTAASLAKNFQSQGQFERAERLVVEVVQLRTEKLGKVHPLVLASRTDLMWILHDQKKHQEAEAVQVDSITAGGHARERKNQSILKCMSALASMYKVQGRLQESLKLYQMVLQTRIEVVGDSHHDTTKTTQDIETVKGLIMRQHEYETIGKITDV